MGLYLNVSNAGFRSARKGEYVDKAEPIYKPLQGRAIQMARNLYPLC